MGISITSEQKHNLHVGKVERVQYSNGAVFLHLKTPHLNASSLCVWFLVGSRDERKDEEGITHLIEHMIFREGFHSIEKGFLKQIEEFGAEVNAFTTKETVCFELSALAKRIPDIFNNFIDMILAPTFSNDKLSKEKNVVIQEIKEDLNDYEVMSEERAFKECFSYALGHPIAGSVKSVRSLSSLKLERFYEKYFNPKRMVITLVGDAPSTFYKRKLMDIFDKHGLTKRGQPQRAKLQDKLGRIKPFKVNYYRAIEISNLVIATRGTCFNSTYRTDLLLLNSYLTDGMTSVLFKLLREEEGLVYSTSSYTNSFRDNGNMIISIACRRRNMDKIFGKVEEALENISGYGVPKDRIAMGKRQILDSWELSFDNVEELNAYLSRGELYRGKFLKFEEGRNMVKAIDFDRLRYLATQILENGLSYVKVVGT